VLLLPLVMLLLASGGVLHADVLTLAMQAKTRHAECANVPEL
jgi:hypothetical protein